MTDPNPFEPACPLPIARRERVLLAHGGGGQLMNDLIKDLFLEHFGPSGPPEGHDGAILELPEGRLALTTDSYVVQPIVFPGGDIGAMAVHGTVNDLAMCGARPLWLTAGFILEEGFPIADLRRVVESMAAAARETGVRIVTGDTKVVDRGKGDGIYINTAGVGVVPAGRAVSPAAVRPGDVVILSGDIGRHGIAVMAGRKGIELECDVESDLAPVHHLTEALFGAGLSVHCLRDLTRGGLASALNEIARSAGAAIGIVEESVPVVEGVRAACELLGFDPLYVANEGRFIAFVPEEEADRALDVLRPLPNGDGARAIGRVETGRPGQVRLQTTLGTTRLLAMMSGEQLPRIC